MAIRSRSPWWRFNRMEVWPDPNPSAAIENALLAAQEWKQARNVRAVYRRRHTSSLGQYSRAAPALLQLSQALGILTPRFGQQVCDAASARCSC